MPDVMKDPKTYLSRAINADRLLHPHRHRRYKLPEDSAVPLMDNAAGALAWQSRQLPDLLTAQLIAFDQERPDMVYQLTDALVSLFGRKPQLENEDCYAMAIDVAKTADPDTGLALEAAMRLAMARRLIKQDRLPIAEPLLATAREQFDSAGDQHGDGEVLDAEGRLRLAAGEHAEAAASYRCAIDIFTDLEDRHARLTARRGLARALAAQGRTVEALDIAEELPAYFEQGIEPVDHYAIARCYLDLADTLTDDSEPVMAQAELNKATGHIDLAGAPLLLARLRVVRSRIHFAMGRRDQAQADLHEAYALYVRERDHHAATKQRLVLATLAKK